MTENSITRLTYKDVECLLQKAIEKKRDLHISINSDGTFELDFSIPSRLSTSTYSEPDE